jgi:hypothetical protein
LQLPPTVTNSRELLNQKGMITMKKNELIAMAREILNKNQYVVMPIKGLSSQAD